MKALRSTRRGFSAIIAILLAALSSATSITPSSAAGPLDQINHIVVVYQENWSFDSLYGLFPGANGIVNAGDTVKQVDKNGQPYATLPQPLDNTKKPTVSDT